MKEMKIRLQKALKGLNNHHERHAALRQVNNYIAHLENVQQMDVVTRLSYWECAYAVFDYLRRNKQLGRTVGKFDAEIKQVLDDIIRELLNEYNEHGFNE
jgi:hypothetical protein